MSHFVTWVIVPADAPAEAAAEAALAPFDENLDVDEYSRECRCGEWRARMRASELARAQNEDLVNEVALTRARFDRERIALLDAGDDAALGALRAQQGEFWETHMAPVAQRIQVSEEMIFQTDPNRDIPDPACHDCRGAGSYLSTYNPDSKWDWWQVGGRWSGEFDPTEAGRDVLGVAEVIATPPAFTPVAVLTPDGEWHEEGRMGWFGAMSDRKDEAAWYEEVAALLAGHTDHMIVVCDLHI